MTAFHPDLARIARVLPRHPVRPSTAPWLRRAIAPLGALPGRGVEIHRVGATRIRVHRPPTARAAAPAVLWIHGGGFVIGSPTTEDGACRRLARDLGAIVAAVDYRLAPAHPFPTPLHDCHDALVWLAGLDGVDPARVAIAGGSAGGGLAAGLALLARDRDEVRPVAQILTYPMLDDRTVGCDDLDETHFRLWNQASNHLGWAAYLGTEPGGEQTSPLAAPARATDLTGLPPAWIGVGTLDLFHDEDVRYAEALQAAGTRCDLLVVDGAFHGFDSAAPRAKVSRDFHAARDAVLRRAFAERA